MDNQARAIYTSQSRKDAAILLSEPLINRRKLRLPCGHVSRYWWRFFVRNVGTVFECCDCFTTWEYVQRGQVSK
jgi:hypothetical protein